MAQKGIRAASVAGEHSFSPAVIIPAFRRLEATRKALESIRAMEPCRVILVDDEGTAGGRQLAAEFPQIEVLTTASPVWWTGAIALGIRRALDAGDSHVLFFNQDVRVTPGYLDRLRETAGKFPGALIGSTILYASEPERVWSAGGKVEWFGRGIRVCHFGDSVTALPNDPFPADWLFGMGTLVPAGVFAEIGLPDAERFPMAWGDTDFSLRASEHGIPVIVDPKARLLHEVGDYDARTAGPPSARRYVEWLRDPKHNSSLSAHAEIWRRHGPRGLWPLSLAMRILVLTANYVRIRLLFPGEGRD